ncbi:phosphonate ABC transporter ATP-binding protein [Haloarcula marismortui]|uniref:ABC transporter n=1 Tax=Haloarcula marismortui ATCC 33800 TaxID=662476 RepID=M0JTU5_9EURY|nr:ATP-binding cassette domain-containing protein [Haloarcula sinaiiensis]EMA11090.1 ABC transporter [Haloarcula sinaiiensis ATCC 33800]QUJ74372.1 ATP-binding cassette domain-containing protein [Haloarcula sinaiiensis ATCC 33800]
MRSKCTARPEGKQSGQGLVFDSVTKRFGGKVAVRDVSLKLEAGERVAVIGPSGAGKTTLLRLAAGALQPDVGTVRFNGSSSTGSTATLAYQGETLVDRRTALSNVLTGRLGALSWLRGFIEPLLPQHPEPALERLDAVGLVDRADVPVKSLSAGERQRVAFARALMQDAEVVLADEPTANLDPSSRRNVIDVLDAALDGELLVTVLHEVDLALEHFDRIVGMADGRVRFDTPARAVTDDQLDALFAAGASTPGTDAERTGTEKESDVPVPRYV